MNVIRTRNVHRILPLALEIISSADARPRGSRNGPVRQVSGPVSTVYEKPLERVMFWSERDANPFFHFFEALWMLGGRRDVASVSRFAKNMGNYSDNGVDFHGAYGYRWRQRMPRDATAFDQLDKICAGLAADHTDRRQVLQMWDSLSDLSHDGKDVPCNVTATFQVCPDGDLHLVVFNRSNDIIWGCYGANAVQFATLLEYVAARTKIPVGTYTQISVNWHGYDATVKPLYQLMLESPLNEERSHSHQQEIPTLNLEGLIDEPCPYETGQVKPYPLMDPSTDPAEWDRALHRLLRADGKAPTEGIWPDPYFTEVAIPILRAHDAYKEGTGEDRYLRSMKLLETCMATDWRLACTEWIARRFGRYTKDADDGVSA